ncbi:MAG: alanine--tRNA ligase [Anaerolineales bacterium]|nr:alanine--tRNA ligase [Anaerolineales bacterium]
MSDSKQPKKAAENPSSAEIRQSFLDFFEARGHTVVPSASLVPGEDETLLFTNAGMVQFKDVFLGTGSRPYSRAVDSQKCMRVAGKHNDLDDVGRDDTHHTFFEMLGNWSFGDYYKEEAITWAWELLTEQWGLPKEDLYATCFEDEQGQIPRDDEAAQVWSEQPGFNPDNILFFGRDENFWEMADTGPCGPDSEIHLDRGPEYCDMSHVNGHECQVNGDCQRYLELWNLVFIQYNRSGPDALEPLPEQHVDTGMGFERIVSVLQGVDSNYRTDLFTPLLSRVQEIAGHSDDQRAELLTPYRVIADHARAATFLIGDGVVPGNTGRNYVCRMIIRRASRFGSYAGFDEPFLAEIAKVVVQEYGDFYPEIRRNRDAILRTITEEERRFQRTVEAGVSHLEERLDELESADRERLGGEAAFELYATYGLPLEITRDISRERGFEVDEQGFQDAMEAHREASAAEDSGKQRGGPSTSFFRELLKDLETAGKLSSDGVEYAPYGSLEVETALVGLIRGDERIEKAEEGDRISAVLPRTSFYVESGGQVSDQGTVVSVDEPRWELEIEDTWEPVDGLILHSGIVRTGSPEVGDKVLAAVHEQRRLDIQRNHTGTHLLHAALRDVLGDHVRQAGSLVAPDRLRFDFTHPEALRPEEIEAIESWVNQAVLANYPLKIRHEDREQAIQSGAMALFGETYGADVRTVTIGESEAISYELCGGTHVAETGIIGPFLITSESSAAAGIRRIEAITGRAALNRINRIRGRLDELAQKLDTNPDSLESRVDGLLEQHEELQRELQSARARLAQSEFDSMEPEQIAGIPVLTGRFAELPLDVLRELTDRFRAEYDSGVIVLATSPDGQPQFVAAVTEDLVERGLHAGDLVKAVAEVVGGGGGGRPTLAQAGGNDASQIPAALDLVPEWIQDHLS